MNDVQLAYKLKQSQVSTPAEIVDLYWSVLSHHRPSPKKVLDMGAGDCRFAINGNYDVYEGVEIDKSSQIIALPQNASVRYGCVFDYPGNYYDACIGNPPYVRMEQIKELKKLYHITHPTRY